MLSLLATQARLITAGVLSLLAQGILLTPAGLALFPQFLPWGSVAIGAILFLFSMGLYILEIRSISMKNSIGWHSNGILLLIQAISVIGIFFISGSNASSAGEFGFLLTGIISILTTYLMFPSNAPESDFRQQATDNIHLDLTSDSDATINALNEQINSLAQQLI